MADEKTTKPGFITDEAKAQIELEARRVLADEVNKYREFLEKQFRLTMWSMATVAALFTGAFIYFFGKSAAESQAQLAAYRTEIKSTLEKEVSQRVIEYAIYQELEERVQKIAKMVIAVSADKIIREKVTEIVPNKVLNSTVSVKVLSADTYPAYEPRPVETKIGEQFDVPQDFGGMFRYQLNFTEPVDIVIPQQLSYTNQWTLWKVQRDPHDISGKKWVVSFQQPRSGEAAGKPTGIGQASFLGLKFSISAYPDNVGK